MQISNYYHQNNLIASHNEGICSSCMITSTLEANQTSYCGFKGDNIMYAHNYINYVNEKFQSKCVYACMLVDEVTMASIILVEHLQ